MGITAIEKKKLLNSATSFIEDTITAIGEADLHSAFSAISTINDFSLQSITSKAADFTTDKVYEKISDYLEANPNGAMDLSLFLYGENFEIHREFVTLLLPSLVERAEKEDNKLMLFCLTHLVATIQTEHNALVAEELEAADPIYSAENFPFLEPLFANFEPVTYTNEDGTTSTVTKPSDPEIDAAFNKMKTFIEDAKKLNISPTNLQAASSFLKDYANIETSLGTFSVTEFLDNLVSFQTQIELAAKRIEERIQAIKARPKHPCLESVMHLLA